MSDLRIAFVDNSVMDSVAQKLKAYVEGALPDDLLGQLYITSAHRGSSGVDYHEDMGDNGALDIAAPMTDAGQRAMQAAARILIQDKDLLLELIHTTPFSDDNGFYVKNGQTIGSYGAATDAAHLNHIHLATNESMGAQLMARHPKGAAPQPAPTPTPVPDDSTLQYGHDGSDFTKVRNFAGLAFVTNKVTEVAPEETYVHTSFGPVMEAARAQGVPFLGAYVVPRTGVDAGYAAQVAINEVNRQAPWVLSHPGFFWQVDLEHWGYDDVDGSVGEALAVELENRTGKRALMYGSHGQYGNSIPGTRPLWNANYNGSGSGTFLQQYQNVLNNGTQGWDAYSGRTPMILQYSSDSTFADGNTGDANVFRGSLADFAAMINGTAVTPVPVPTPDPAPVDDRTPTGFPPFKDNDTYMTVQSGDTLSSIASDYGTTWQDIQSINTDVPNPDEIYPGQVLRVKVGGGNANTAPRVRQQFRHYWVQPGDSLSSIASENGTTVEHILAVNDDIPDPDLIYPGQELIFV